MEIESSSSCQKARLAVVNEQRYRLIELFITRRAYRSLGFNLLSFLASPHYINVCVLYLLQKLA